MNHRCQTLRMPGLLLLGVTLLAVLHSGAVAQAPPGALGEAVKRVMLPYVARLDGSAPPPLTPTPVTIAPPDRINPTKGATLNTLAPDFVIDNSNLLRAAYANVQVCRDAELTQQELAYMTNSFAGRATSTMTRNLPEGTTFYWRARSSADGSHWGPRSEVWTFTTPASGPLPAQCGLITPANGVTLPNRRPTFTWNSVPLASKYLLKVGTGMILVTGTQVALSSDLTASQVYTWSITARTGYGYGPQSAVWSFTTAAATGMEEMIDGE